MRRPIQQDELAELQRWYEDQCDGSWAREFGVRIETLDNPGWSVEIDLAETPLAGRAFPPIRQTAAPREWLFCEVSGKKFRWAGGPPMLGCFRRAFSIGRTRRSLNPTHRDVTPPRILAGR